jgi:hypothetical protein
MRHEVSGASPFNTSENTCEASKPLKVAECQPSACSLLHTSFINTPLLWNLVLKTVYLSPLTRLHLLLSPFFSHRLLREYIKHSGFFLFTTTALSHHHSQSCIFPTVAPTKSNCLAPHFWHHSLLPWKVPPIQHDDFFARRRGCSERETTFDI